VDDEIHILHACTHLYASKTTCQQSIGLPGPDGDNRLERHRTHGFGRRSVRRQHRYRVRSWRTVSSSAASGHCVVSRVAAIEHEKHLPRKMKTRAKNTQVSENEVNSQAGSMWGRFKLASEFVRSKHRTRLRSPLACDETHVRTGSRWKFTSFD
jgi:hypothetical protein